ARNSLLNVSASTRAALQLVHRADDLEATGLEDPPRAILRVHEHRRAELDRVVPARANQCAVGAAAARRRQRGAAGEEQPDGPRERARPGDGLATEEREPFAARPHAPARVRLGRLRTTPRGALVGEPARGELDLEAGEALVVGL